MKRFELTYKPYGERSILIEWPSEIDEKILNDVINFKNTLQINFIKEKVYIKSAYNSILISYMLTINNIYDKVSILKRLYSKSNTGFVHNINHWKIPVCYDDEFGIDLDEMSRELGMIKSELITLHCQPRYMVFFLGFLPGFLYLGGLHDSLHFPRKNSPRLKVKKGAVAIGGNQTGVYPNSSPGGWNIIGNSPINFFEVTKIQPCFASPGDSIQFYPICKKEHLDIKTLVEAGVYQLESEVTHD